MSGEDFDARERATLRRFAAYFDPSTSDDERADLADLDAGYEAESDRLFTRRLAIEGRTVEREMGDLDAYFDDLKSGRMAAE